MPFTILDRKDAVLAPLPLLLVTITWRSGQVLRLCSNKEAAGVNYGGHTYLARILNDQIAAAQILGEQGIDHAPSMALKLADADKWVFTNHENARGFKGARVVARFVFFDVVTGEYSTDAYTKFVGVVMDPPTWDETTFSIQARSRMSMGGIQFPRTRIQKLCPWTFPRTQEERQAAADDPRSIFYRCGYSPDSLSFTSQGATPPGTGLCTGANARGNFRFGDFEIFTSCDYTDANCRTRGMYSQDKAGRDTGRFGGIQWVPVDTLLTRSFRGEWETIQTPGNDARYNDFIPLVYGTVATDPSVLNFPADGNYTKCEVLLHEGQIEDIVRVIVNDVEIPHTYDDTELSSVPPGVSNRAEALRIGWWKCVNKGDRTGKPNDDALYDSKGDPYGSLAVISITVVKQIAAAGSAPRVRIILKGPKVRVFSDATTSTLALTQSPPWVLANILGRSGWDDEDIDFQSFVDAAAFCAETIPYKNQFGADATHARFTANMIVRQRKSAADIIRGLRNASRLNLTQDWSAGGKLQLSVRSTLAKEQPAAIAGSNYNTAIASMLPNGTAANGYAAYHFDETTVLKDEPVEFSQRNEANRLGFQFQNAENRYSTDSLAIADTEDIDRVGSESAGNVAVEGITDWDQARRIIATLEAEGFRGNPRNDAYDQPIGDTGGTIQVTFSTTFRAIHLKPGQLVIFSDQQHGIDKQVMRVLQLQPSTNFAKIRVTLQWHNDYWYLDTFGQAGAPRYRSPHRNPNLRGVYSWLPHAESPTAGDAWRAIDDWGFRVSQSYEPGADGSSIARITARGFHPVNKVLASNPPYVPLQGTTAATGGTIPGGRTYYIAITAGENLVGFEDYQTAPGELTTIAVPSGTNTNTVIVSGLVWEDDARRGFIYIGTDRTKLVLAEYTSVFAPGSGPTSITITDLPPAVVGVPDLEYDHLEFEAREVLLSGVWTAKVSAATSSSITVELPDGGSFVADEWAGRELSVLAIQGNDWVPFVTFSVTGNNTSGTLNVSGDPTSLWTGGTPYSLQAGDVVAMRAKWTVGSGYVEDAKLDNIFRPGGLNADALKGGVMRWIYGAGRDTTATIASNTATRLYADFPATPDSTSRGIVLSSSIASTGRSAGPIDSWNPNNEVDTVVELPNVAGMSYFVLGLTANAAGDRANPNNSPWREIYLAGGAGAGQGSLGLQLTVQGTLAIGSDLSPRTQLSRTVRAVRVRAEVKQAPTGADLVVVLKLGATTWLTLTIADGDTFVEATSGEIAGASDLTADTNIRLDVTAAGTTFPGADLTVSIYL
jgi:hypothetical protein